MRKQNLAFIDIETTGLNVILHEIIEIGCVLVGQDLEVIEEFEIKIKPEKIQDADPVALRVNHFNEEDWAGAVSLKDALLKLRDKTKDAIMVGQNVAFDSSFLDYAFTELGIKNEMHYHKLDTMSLAWAKLHRDETVNRFSLREMCERFDIKNERAHSALSDARATYELYKKLMEL